MVLTGRKAWISGAQSAGLFLVSARIEDLPTILLVEAGTEGMAVSPRSDMAAFRAAMMGDVEFDGCRLRSEAIIGRPGLGLSHVVASALQTGRNCIAYGSLGLGEACIEAALRHAETRSQGGQHLIGHQLIQEMLAESFVDLRAARHLCCESVAKQADGDPDAILEACLAKYAASRAAARAASHAVQIHGAQAFVSGHLIERHARDSRVLEIIEGSTQVLTGVLAHYASQVLCSP
jgi:alkylation response protein AidB-like acyl-CoA dehydrogenase